MDLWNLAISAKLTKEGGGGGGDIDVDALTVTENGVYSASSGHAYSPVTVSVPQSGITPTGTSVITANGLYDVTDFASASVSVPVGVFPSGTSSITSNGIYDITNFASVDVNVAGGGGGDHDVEDALIEKTISGTYTNSRVTNIASYTFQFCTALTTVNFPNATNIGSNAFRSCTALTTVSFPNATNIASYTFQSCTALTTVSFPNATNIGNYAFQSCNALMSAYFLAPSVAALATVSTFQNTPMSKSTYTGSFGSIYVPASLVSDYKAATNWSTYADRITSYVE